jgi:hypothetical protein
MWLTVFTDDTCPRCLKPTKLSYIEPHPTQSDLAVHDFVCADCGTVKSKIISLRPINPRLKQRKSA